MFLKGSIKERGYNLSKGAIHSMFLKESIEGEAKPTKDNRV